MKKEPPSRRLSLNVLRQDFFVLAGMQSLKKFYVRADIRDGEVRGMAVLYDQATDTTMDAVAVAMAGTFAAFPPFLENARAAAIGPLPRRKVEYGTGIVVSAAGHILTDRALTDGCTVILAGGYGGADRIAHDEASDLALLRIYGERTLVPAAFTSELVKGADLTLVGIADPQSQTGGNAASTMAAKLKGDSADPAPPLGFSGAAALDRQGRLVGMVGIRNQVIATADFMNAPQAVVVPAHTIRAFLHENNVVSAATRSPGGEAAKASLLRVICVRK
jgi:S1-C subfamily serine protease